jgi:hypothetical protein
MLDPKMAAYHLESVGTVMRRIRVPPADERRA